MSDVLSADPVGAFMDAIRTAGLEPPEQVTADGELHRFSTNGKRSDDSGWYILHLDGIAAGAFGDWRTGVNEKWCAGKESEFTEEQGKERGKRMRALQRRRDREKKLRQDEAAADAAKSVEKLSPAPADHPYFKSKGIHTDVLVDDDRLVVPMTDPDGRIASLQFIDGDGSKRFLPGGRVNACYFGIRGDEVVVIAEGLATGASIHAATGHSVAVAFNACNLTPVAEVMRRAYPKADIVIAADNDVRDDDTENTGIVKATAAAHAVGGRLVVPELDGKKCDFNDVHQAKGLDAVREQINGRSSARTELVDEVRTFIARFCAFPDEHGLTAVTLWAVHAHLIETFHTTPRLALLSPEPASGKTRVLEVLDLLAPETMLALNASSATIFRTLAKRQITLLFDECDAIWTKRGKDDDHQDLRALLNAGYKRGATIPRCVGAQHEVVMFPVFAAVALAGIGDLPDTIMSRAVIIRMRRRAPGEKIEPFRSRLHEPEGHKLRDRLATWSARIRMDWPVLPPGIDDRPAEIWEPLLMIADAAGGHWPATARAACVELCRAAEDRSASLGIRLLADLRIIFALDDALYTATILKRLTDGEDLDEDAPWAELRGKPLGIRGLATMLKKYGITSRKVRENGGRPLQGYRRDDLWDAWRRYLPSLTVAEVEHPEQTEHVSNDAGSSRSVTVPAGEASGTAGTEDVPYVPGKIRPGTHPEQGNGSTVRVVPDVPDERDPDGRHAVYRL